MSRLTIPEEIAMIEKSLRGARGALSCEGISVETQEVIEGIIADDERALKRLRREFEDNRKALDADRV